MLYLLDTNILLAYMRGATLEAYIEAVYGLSEANPVPIVSIVSEAEIRVLAFANKWGAPRLELLQQMLDRLRIVPIPFEDIMDAYVAVEAVNRKQARSMGKNDIWIAATAHVTGARLLTTDRDFDHLHDSLLKRDWIDPASRL